eukprot:TRINITY_DN39549_c0_g1_i1.p1 TRINITY_DN39549_c0_g1~~TRINITY_DN39549_c0_g1_i1.p1  ORF type:complete len:534 (+),score=113.20 TRINITY_DN39549_c0_g1_i1:59-1603(+)
MESRDWRVHALRAAEHVCLAAAVWGFNRRELRRFAAAAVAAVAGGAVRAEYGQLTVVRVVVAVVTALAAWLSSRVPAARSVLAAGLGFLLGCAAANAELPPPPPAAPPSPPPVEAPRALPAVAETTEPAGPRSLKLTAAMIGVWRADRARSDSLDDTMAQLQVPWPLRKLMLMLDIRFGFEFCKGEHPELVTTVEAYLSMPRHQLFRAKEDPVPLAGRWARWASPAGEEGWGAGMVDSEGILRTRRVAIQVGAGMRGELAVAYGPITPAGELPCTIRVLPDDGPEVLYRAIMTRVGEAPTPERIADAASALSSAARNLPSGPHPTHDSDEEDAEGDWHPTITGDWRMDLSKTDSIDALLREMEMPWVARRVIRSLEVWFQYRQTHRTFAHVMNSVMQATERYHLDGKERPFCRLDGVETTVRADVLPDGSTRVTRLRQGEAPAGTWNKSIETWSRLSRRRVQSRILLLRDSQQVLDWRCEMTPHGWGAEPNADALDRDWASQFESWRQRNAAAS